MRRILIHKCGSTVKYVLIIYRTSLKHKEFTLYKHYFIMITIYPYIYKKTKFLIKKLPKKDYI